MFTFSAAAVTRFQAKQSEKAYRKLRFPDQIINGDKEALKQSKKISNDQELIQSDPTSCPQNLKGNN